MENGKFRTRKQNPYSQVSNHLIMNSSLSFKAKGLFATIVYYLSIPNFVLYRQTLINSSTDGETAFRSAWKELKDAGYLVQYKLKGEKGTFIYEYELLDTPESTSGKSTCGISTSGESTSLTREVQNKNIQNKNLNTNNDVVQSELVSEFVNSIQEYINEIKTLPEYYSSKVMNAYTKTIELLSLAPKTLKDASKMNRDASVKLLSLVKALYYPDDEDELDNEKRGYIANKEGYIYGCLANIIKGQK